MQNISKSKNLLLAFYVLGMVALICIAWRMRAVHVVCALGISRAARAFSCSSSKNRMLPSDSSNPPPLRSLFPFITACTTSTTRVHHGQEEPSQRWWRRRWKRGIGCHGRREIDGTAAARTAPRQCRDVADFQTRRGPVLALLLAQAREVGTVLHPVVRLRRFPHRFGHRDGIFNEFAVGGARPGSSEQHEPRPNEMARRSWPVGAIVCGLWTCLW